MTIRAKKQRTELVIDLTGPDGNAFNLLGLAFSLSRQLGWSKLACEGVVAEMKLHDYEHLVQTFDKHFGDYVVLER